MANGDVASAAGFFTPVSSGADFRVGYDDINRLADAAAKGAGLGAWSLAPISLSTPGFSTLTDTAGLTTGGLTGGVKVAGGQILGSFRCARGSGQSTLSADSFSNLPDTLVCTLAAGYRPGAVRYGTFVLPGFNQGSFRLSPDGTMTIVSLDANNTIPAGTVLQFDFALAL